MKYFFLLIFGSFTIVNSVFGIENSLKTHIKLNLTGFSEEVDSLVVEIKLFDSFLGTHYRLYQSFLVPSSVISIDLSLPEISSGIINIKSREKIVSSSGSIIFNGDTLVGQLSSIRESLIVRGGENEFMQENFTLPFNLPSLITNNSSYKPKMVQRSYDLQIPENPILQAIYMEYLRNVLKLVKQYPNSFHILRKLNDNASNITLKELDTALTIFNEKLINTVQGRKLKVFIANGKWLLNKPDLYNVQLTNIKGVQLSLGSMVDSTKFTLIDFWASWCVPCRQFNASLVQNYASLDKSKVQIISISLDEDIQKWKTAIEKDKLSWINLIDPSFKGFNGDLAKLFNILFIPQSFLFDKNGNIVQMNISLEELIEISK